VGRSCTWGFGTSAPAKLRRSSVRWRPGTNSSSTAWKFVPPNPNALTPPRRGSPIDTGHSRNSVLTRNGEVAQSTFGLGSWKCRLGASIFSCRLMTILNRPAVPAAALRWPMFDFTEPSAMDPGAAPAFPNTFVMLSSSAASPTRVDVPCASIADALAGSTPACCHAPSTANRCPTGFGAVMPLPLPSLDPAAPSSTA
jgi:hypothetical protein